MLSPSATRYLLAIYELSNGGCAVRSVDIAKALCVSRASVVKSLKKLCGYGLIQKEFYGNVHFTPAGIRESNRIYTEYTLLYCYFLEFLNSSPEASRSDAICALCFFSCETKEKLIQISLTHVGKKA